MAHMLATAVPWPAHTAGTPCNRTAKEMLHATAAAWPCVRLAFCCAGLSSAEGVALLRAAFGCGREVWLAEFKTAERNLELPAVGLAWLTAWLAACGGKECGKKRADELGEDFVRERGGEVGNFWSRGAVEGLLHTAGLAGASRRVFWGGAAVLVRVQQA